MAQKAKPEAEGQAESKGVHGDRTARKIRGTLHLTRHHMSHRGRRRPEKDLPRKKSGGRHVDPLKEGKTERREKQRFQNPNSRGKFQIGSDQSERKRTSNNEKGRGKGQVTNDFQFSIPYAVLLPEMPGHVDRETVTEEDADCLMLRIN